MCVVAMVGRVLLLLVLLFRNIVEASNNIIKENAYFDLEDLGPQNKKAWRPEREIDADKDAWEAVQDEVWRSLSIYDDDEDMFEMFIKCENKFVLIINGRIFVSPNFDDDYQAGKARKHLAMMYVIAQERWGGLPNSAYLINLGARGEDPLDFDSSKTNKECSHKLPFFVIAKKMGYDTPGIQIPNPYFDDLNIWQQDRDRTDNAAAKLWPWERRIPKLYWRGGIGCREACFSDMGNYRRWSALVQSWLHPDLIDAKVAVLEKQHHAAASFSVRNGTSEKIVQLSKAHLGKPTDLEDFRRGDCSKYGMPPTNNMLKAYAQLDKNPWVFTDAYVSTDSFVKYQFLLNMPGQAGGSYSKNLNYLWSLGSIVFIWDAHYTEWYYPALRHGLTHLVVDESNAAKTVRMLKANASLASDLRWHARRIYDTFLAPHALADYMRFVLGAFRNKFPKLTETLNDKAKVNAILKRHKCGTSQFPLAELLVPLAEITRGSLVAVDMKKTHKLKLQPIPQDDPDLSACASSVEVIKKLSSRRRLNEEKSQVRHNPELSYHAPFCYVGYSHEENGDKEKKRKRRRRRAFLL